MNLTTVSSEFLAWAKAQSKKRRGELDAVINFLQHEGAKDLAPSDFKLDAEEPVDIQFQYRKFQVVFADFSFQESLGKATSTGGPGFVDGPTRTKSDLWRALIIDPLKKKSHYGKAAKGIILLISTHLSVSLVEKYIALAKHLGSDRELAKLGFDAIYLVSMNETLKVFP